MPELEGSALESFVVICKDRQHLLNIRPGSRATVPERCPTYDFVKKLQRRELAA
jgi:hypothetical protein